MSEQQRFQSVEGVAMLILSMGEEVSSEVLKHFNREEIKQLTHAMSQLHDIKAHDAHQSLSSFFDDYRNHSGIRGGTRKYISNVLQKALDGNMAKDLVSEIYGDEVRSHAETLTWIPADILARDLMQEHIKMQVLLIAHLPPEYSADVLSYFDAESSHEVIFQIAQTEMLNSEIVESLHELIDRCKSNYHEGSTSVLAGQKVVGDIIGRFKGDRSQLMNFLKERDQQLAEQLEEKMLDFSILFRQQPSVIDELSTLIPLELWALALKGVTAEQKGVITGVMPNRVANELDDQMMILGSVPLSRVEQARQEILQTVRQMMAEERITISLYEEASVS